MVNYEKIKFDPITGNGANTPLSENQYRVVLRTGFHNISSQSRLYDYHFWYQTYDGRWANKHGTRGVSTLLPSGTTPFTSGSSGWALDTYQNFYDGNIYSYIITVK